MQPREPSPNAASPACVKESGWVRQFLKIGASGPIPSTVYVKPQDRKMAPDFTLTDSAGKPVRVSEFRGHVVLVNFWATWCGSRFPCSSAFSRHIATAGLSSSA